MQGTAVPTIDFSINTIPVGQIIPVFFTLVFVIWLIYTFIAAYHWIRYSSSISVASTALATHLIVSSFLAIFAVSNLH